MTSDSHDCCKGYTGTQSALYSQTFDEVEFERGIWQAALDNNKDRVKHLLLKGTSPNKQDQSGYSALHYAARAGHMDIAKFLLDNGADVNAQTKCGKDTPLHRAAYQGHSNIVTLLLEYKADPCAQNSDGQTPIHKAAQQGHFDVAKILSDCAPRVKRIKDCQGCLPDDMVDQQK